MVIAYALTLAILEALDENATTSLKELLPIVIFKLSNIIYHINKSGLQAPNSTSNEQESIHNVDTKENSDRTL